MTFRRDQLLLISLSSFTQALKQYVFYSIA